MYMCPFVRETKWVHRWCLIVICFCLSSSNKLSGCNLSFLLQPGDLPHMLLVSGKGAIKEPCAFGFWQTTSNRKRKKGLNRWRSFVQAQRDLILYGSQLRNVSCGAVRENILNLIDQCCVAGHVWLSNGPNFSVAALCTENYAKSWCLVKQLFLFLAKWRNCVDIKCFQNMYLKKIGNRVKICLQMIKTDTTFSKQNLWLSIIQMHKHNLECKQQGYRLFW